MYDLPHDTFWGFHFKSFIIYVENFLDPAFQYVSESNSFGAKLNILILRI